MVNIGGRIKAARKAAKMSQTVLAVKLNKSLRTVQKYESGEIELTLPLIEEISKALGVSWEGLLGCQKRKYSHIMLFEVKRVLGPHRVEEVVLYNGGQISLKEAARCVNAGLYNKNVLCIPKNQWVSLFQNGRVK